MKIAFSGLTAAGKTTHSKLLAESLGAEWLGATSLLAELAGVPPPSEGESLWLGSAGTQIEAAREGDQLDRELDRILVRRFAEADSMVADAWALPWVLKEPGVIRVWLESDLPSRTRKCLVSQLPRPTMDASSSETHVTCKDESTKLRFHRLYGFDLFADRGPFDVILDNSALIPAPTRACADAGIEAFAPVVEAAVRLAAGDSREGLVEVLDAGRELGVGIHLRGAPVT